VGGGGAVEDVAGVVDAGAADAGVGSSDGISVVEGEGWISSAIFATVGRLCGTVVGKLSKTKMLLVWISFGRGSMEVPQRKPLADALSRADHVYSAIPNHECNTLVITWCGLGIIEAKIGGHALSSF
jgi:hypothetical protein